MTEAPVILRFPATGFVVILIYLFAPYVSSNPTQDIGFRAVDDTLGIGSACKFSGNNSMGICVELTLCQGADVDFHVHRISPTTCSFINNKFPIVCCLGANDFRATSPTLPSLPVQPVVPVLPTPTTGLEHNLERKSAACKKFVPSHLINLKRNPCICRLFENIRKGEGGILQHSRRQSNSSRRISSHGLWLYCSLYM